MNLGLRPNKLGTAQNSGGGLAGRPKAFRTSDGVAEDRQKLLPINIRSLTANIGTDPKYIDTRPAYIRTPLNYLRAA